MHITEFFLQGRVSKTVAMHHHLRELRKVFSPIRGIITD